MLEIEDLKVISQETYLLIHSKCADWKNLKPGNYYVYAQIKLISNAAKDDLEVQCLVGLDFWTKEDAWNGAPPCLKPSQYGATNVYARAI